MSDSVRTKLAPDVDLAGRELGGYRLLRRLGRGAMAEVYLAEQLSLGRQVALKVLRSDLADDEIYVKRFHQEARAAASLVHSNIVQIYEVGRLDGVHYIAQEYVSGLNLGELLTRRGVPQTKVAVAIMRQVTLALCKAAEQGIVHRDIKPENIMLTVSGEAKVADFGLARVATDEVAVGLTQAGFTMGTPLYMSPEQVQGKVLDSRSDIYSFGVTCYHMLTGELPFHGDTALSVAVQHLQNAPPRLENARPDLPPALCRIIHKMLAKQPDERYASPKELLAELRTVPIDTGDASADVDYLSQEFSSAAAEGRRGVTNRLGELMRTEAVLKTSMSRGRRWIIGGVATGILFGLGLAWAAQPEALLTAAAGNGKPPDRTTAADQFKLAEELDTEEGWLYVVNHDKAGSELVRRAHEQLALYYLNHNEPEKAGRQFADLAAKAEQSAQGTDDPMAPQQLWFATSGQAVAAFKQGHDAEATALLNRLWEHREQLIPPTRDLLKANLPDFPPAVRGQWQEELTKPFRFGPPGRPGDRGPSGRPPEGPRPDGPPGGPRSEGRPDRPSD